MTNEALSVISTLWNKPATGFKAFKFIYWEVLDEKVSQTVVD